MSEIESPGGVPTGGAPGGEAAGPPGAAPPAGTQVATRQRQLPVISTGMTPEDERYYEKWVAFWFLFAALGGIGFFAWMWWGPPPRTNGFTPVLGVFLAIAVGGLGIGVIQWAKTLIGPEEAVQLRERLYPTNEERDAAVNLLDEGIGRTGITRYKLLRRSLLAGGALAITLPLLSVLRYLNINRPRSGALTYNGWGANDRMVDYTNTPVRLGDLEVGALTTVFPENKVDVALAPTLLINLGAGINRPRPGRASWEAEGHVAYSKICTHLGCPVGLYEQQRHILLCPCHQSQFNVQSGCKVMFGPAARPLPQLDIYVDNAGYFRARGPYDQPVGPSFWERK